jgi:hypothetical protein
MDGGDFYESSSKAQSSRQTVAMESIVGDEDYDQEVSLIDVCPHQITLMSH